MSIKCDRCNKGRFTIVKGTESKDRLLCAKCGQWHYFVHWVHIALYLTDKVHKDEDKKYVNKLRKALGVPVI